MDIQDSEPAIDLPPDIQELYDRNQRSITQDMREKGGEEIRSVLLEGRTMPPEARRVTPENAGAVRDKAVTEFERITGEIYDNEDLSWEDLDSYFLHTLLDEMAEYEEPQKTMILPEFVRLGVLANPKCRYAKLIYIREQRICGMIDKIARKGKPEGFNVYRKNLQAWSDLTDKLENSLSKRSVLISPRRKFSSNGGPVSAA